MKTTTLFRTIAAALAIASAMSLAATTTSAKEPPIHLDAVKTSAGGFFDLAAYLNTQASWRVSTQLDSTTPHCGTAGECNYAVCPETKCPDGTAPSCSCESSGDQCGFFTKYPVYNCTCKCTSTAPPSPPPPPPGPKPICIGPVCVQPPTCTATNARTDASQVIGVPKPIEC